MNELFVQSLSIDWSRISPDSYLRRIKAIQSTKELKFDKPVTYFVGENGSGESTMLEAIAVTYGFNPEGGSQNYSFSTYDSCSELCDVMRLGRGWRKSSWGYFLRAESFYNVATKEMDYSDADHPSKKYHEKLHGESILAIVQDNFRANGFYVLDEPEAALSPQRQLTLLLEIDKLSKAGVQFVIASHSPILLGLPGTKICSFDGKKTQAIDYEETESYQIMDMFINNRTQLLVQLLSDK